MKRGANTTTRNPVSSSRRISRGFTLIELLVVIGIIALLIGITVPIIKKVQIAGHNASTQAQLVSIGNAIQQYYGDFHAYPGPLPNWQLGENYQTLPSGVGPDPFIPDPVSGLAIVIQMYQPSSGGSVPFPGSNTDQHITGSENLLLGLIGGLQLRGASGALAYEYNPQLIFPDGVNPSPTGALSLNFQKPKRYQAYLQVRSGDISHPDAKVNNGQFTDPANRHSNDSVIPEFVDQYGDQMPILYLRTNVGGTGIVGFAGADDSGPMTNPITGLPVIPQYDIAQIYDYTFGAPGKAIFTVPGNGSAINPKSYHGLQRVGNFSPTSTSHPGNEIMMGWWDNSSGYGYNALAYLKDPNNPGPANVGGHARQKDGYLLISAGPDRIYGTDDDLIYPGTLLP